MSTYNSRLQSIILGKSRQELQTIGHITATIKSRNECKHAHLLAFAQTEFSTLIQYEPSSREWWLLWWVRFTHINKLEMVPSPDMAIVQPNVDNIDNPFLRLLPGDSRLCHIAN